MASINSLDDFQNNILDDLYQTANYRDKKKFVAHLQNLSFYFNKINKNLSEIKNNSQILKNRVRNLEEEIEDLQTYSINPRSMNRFNITFNPYLRNKVKNLVYSLPEGIKEKIFHLAREKPILDFLKIQDFFSKRSDCFCIDGIYKIMIVLSDFKPLEIPNINDSLDLPYLFDRGLIYCIKIDIANDYNKIQKMIEEQTLPRRLLDIVWRNTQEWEIRKRKPKIRLSFRSTIPEWVNAGELLNAYSIIFIIEDFQESPDYLDIVYQRPEPIRRVEELASAKARLANNLKYFAESYNMNAQGMYYEVRSELPISATRRIVMSEECGYYADQYEGSIANETEAAIMSGRLRFARMEEDGASTNE